MSSTYFDSLLFESGFEQDVIQDRIQFFVDILQ